MIVKAATVTITLRCGCVFETRSGQTLTYLEGQPYLEKVCTKHAELGKIPISFDTIFDWATDRAVELRAKAAVLEQKARKDGIIE